MGTKKIKNFSIKENLSNILFILMNCSFVVIFIVSLIIAILDKNFNWCDFDLNVFGVLVQVITGILSLVTSILGISISLQTSFCYGISLKDFRNIKTGFRYPIVAIIVISIILIALNALLYFLDLLIASLGVMCIALTFCIFVVISELPLMLKNEEKLNKVLKKYLYKNWSSKHNHPLQQNINIALEYLVVEYFNLLEIYNKLKYNDNEYNKYLIIELLDIQDTAASKLMYVESIPDKIKNAKTILNNINDILSFDLNLVDIFEDIMYINRTLIINTILKISDIPEVKSKAIDIVTNSILELDYINSFKKEKFILSITLPIITTTIMSPDFSLVRALQRNFSDNHNTLGSDSYTTLIFAYISMYLYNLHNSKVLSNKYKEEIKKFINSSNNNDIIQLISWNNLFFDFLYSFELSLERFMILFSKDVVRWHKLSNKDIFIMDDGYAIDWFLFSLLNSAEVENFNYQSLNYKGCNTYKLKYFNEKYYDSDKNFISDKMKEFWHFYSINTELRNSTKLFAFINDLRINGLINNTLVYKDLASLTVDYELRIKEIIKSEFGFSSDIENKGCSSTIINVIERSSKSLHDDNIKSIATEIFNNIRNSTTIKYIKREDFESKILQILREGYTSIGNKVPYLKVFINDEADKKKFVQHFSRAKIFKSNILNGYTLIKDNGFSFNIKFVNFNIRKLEQNELHEITDNYKRMDGQYVYEGAFFSRNNLEKLILAKNAVIEIEMEYGVITEKDSILEINMF